MKHLGSLVLTLLRIWLGLQWLEAGIGKLGNPAWVGSQAGTAISGFFNGAIAKAAGDHPSVQQWYAAFLQNFALPNAKFFSYFIPVAEVAVGLGLIFGCLTTVALLGGAFMNLNFMLSGSTSTNPILYTVAIILLFAGASKYALGIDYLYFRYFKFGRSNDKFKVAKGLS